MTALPEDCNYKSLGGRTLRDLKVEYGNVRIAGPVSKDYELYQRKNNPDTIDIAVTVVMGAPFPLELCNVLNELMEKLKPVFEPYAVRLWEYKDHHIHATVSPIIRTPFDLKKDQETNNKIQRDRIKKRNVSIEDIKKAVKGIPPFSFKVHPWSIEIKSRGEILLWGSESNKKESSLLQLRKRLKPIAGPHARDKGHKVHVALATIHDFHKLTILDKEVIAKKIDNELKLIPDPGDVYIEKVLYVEYRHRSLSRMADSIRIPMEA